jgi:hypothetical protein
MSINFNIIQFDKSTKLIDALNKDFEIIRQILNEQERRLIIHESK